MNVGVPFFSMEIRAKPTRSWRFPSDRHASVPMKVRLQAAMARSRRCRRRHAHIANSNSRVLHVRASDVRMQGSDNPSLVRLLYPMQAVGEGDLLGVAFAVTGQARIGPGEIRGEHGIRCERQCADQYVCSVRCKRKHRRIGDTFPVLQFSGDRLPRSIDSVQWRDLYVRPEYPIRSCESMR